MFYVPGLSNRPSHSCECTITGAPCGNLAPMSTIKKYGVLPSVTLSSKYGQFWLSQQKKDGEGKYAKL